MPRNGQPVVLTFSKHVMADVVGSAAVSMLDQLRSQTPGTASSAIDLPLETVLVTDNFKSKVVSSSDIGSFTSCRMGRVQQGIIVPLPDVVLQLRTQNKISVLAIVKKPLEEVFDSVVSETGSGESGSPNSSSLTVQGVISVYEDLDQDFIRVGWIGSPIGDMIADCALGIIYQTLSASHFIRSSWNNAYLQSLPFQASSPSDAEGGKETKKHCRHSHHGHHGHNHDGEAVSEEEELLVKRMKLGAVDPSRAFTGLEDAVIDLIKDAGNVERNRPKLVKILEYLQTCESEFDSVQISADGLRLIVRSSRKRDGAQGENSDDDIYCGLTQDSPIEAYVFIHWSLLRGHTVHHAVVQSSDDDMRKRVVSAIKKLEGQE
jgi:hypothetical protein